MGIVSDSDSNRRRIRSELVNIYRIIEGYNMQNWKLDGYMQAIGDFNPDIMNEVFMMVLKGTKDNKLPPPGWFVQEYNILSKRKKMCDVVNNIKPIEKNESSFRSTVMSHMYLHYNNGWDVSDAQCIKEVHDKMFPGESYDFKKITEKVPKEMVYNYMSSRNSKVDI